MKQDKEFEQFAKGLRQEVEETFDYIKDTGEITNFVRSKIQKAWNYQQQKLAKAEAALKVAEEAIGFYADKDNWSGTSDVEFAKCIFKRTSDNEYDDEDERLPRAFTSGKRARQAMASMKKVLDE